MFVSQTSKQISQNCFQVAVSTISELQQDVVVETKSLSARSSVMINREPTMDLYLRSARV